MKLTLHPDAEGDIEVAAGFYEREGSPALAARFIREFKRVSQLLLERPEIGAPRGEGRRGLGMRVFPYTVIYRFIKSEENVRILVVKHDKRRPGYGRGRR